MCLRTSACKAGRRGFLALTPCKLSGRFGFEVALVTYKWPNWLRQQTEKQRIIWGYKILFLDTLFPLDLKKIIFVDADQVVRADLTELWDMDLEGKPYVVGAVWHVSLSVTMHVCYRYGYTPFCTSREVCVLSRG